MARGSDPYLLNPPALQSLLVVMQELTIRTDEDLLRVKRI
jgi:hypothetical protein